MNLRETITILTAGPWVLVRSRSTSFAPLSSVSRQCILLLLCLCLAPSRPQTQVPAAREPLTVMSFNIRYGTAPDGENQWTARREMLFDLVRAQNADIIGLQEALGSQIREIAAAVPGYAVVGVGRDDALAKGEYSAILFRTDRLHVAGSGTFWFSDTPEVPASKSWGNNITRICTWARFVDRDGRGFWHFNLHLDHQSQPSRERSTELLRQRIEARAFPGEPVVVTGDFNVGERNPALRTLVAGPPDGGNAQPPAPLVDTFRVVHPDERVVGTFSGFKFGQVNGDKIDYVLVQPGTEVLSADIIRTSRNERYPSDHFPVVARVRLR
jgi:endonuclease/exonuclease/phosphatase family metal-dependent hydrolase